MLTDKQITYRPLTPADRPALALAFGDWILRLRELHFEPGCYTIGAFDGEAPVGFISVYPRTLPAPLSIDDAYIDVIEVAASHRRQGVARTMLAMSEDWARAQGYSQIRAWSTEDKREAIPMWHALGYGLCPVYSGRPRRKSPNGYYVAKPL